MSGTGLNTETLYILSFSPLKMSSRWPLTSVVSDEKSRVIPIMVLLYIMRLLSLAAFIYYLYLS